MNDTDTVDAARAVLEALLKLHGLPWGEWLQLSVGQQSVLGDMPDEDVYGEKAWQALIDRTGPGSFAKRLALDGLDADGARHLVECHSPAGDSLA